jgi:hypothetical protein
MHRRIHIEDGVCEISPQERDITSEPHSRLFIWAKGGAFWVDMR